MKYFCDLCGKEIGNTSTINPRPIAQLTILDPKSKAPSEQQVCVDCTPHLIQFIQEQQNKNGVVPISKDFNLKVK